MTAVSSRSPRCGRGCSHNAAGHRAATQPRSSTRSPAAAQPPSARLHAGQGSLMCAAVAAAACMLPAVACRRHHTHHPRPTQQCHHALSPMAMILTLSTAEAMPTDSVRPTSSSLQAVPLLQLRHRALCHSLHLESFHNSHCCTAARHGSLDAHAGTCPTGRTLA